MGILNSRNRIMDVIMTPNGRSALAAGGLGIAYASFTDGQAFYDSSSVSGSYDTATDRIYLEAPFSLPQDTLAIVTDDSGKLIPVSAFGTNVGSDGTLYLSGSRPVSGSEVGTGFSSAVESVANMFQTSFNYNTIIGTKDPLDQDPDFLISPTEATFYLKNEMQEDLSVTDVNAADSLFFDRRFSNLPQFKFLPPVTSVNGNVRPLARFNNIREFNSFSYSNIKQELAGSSNESAKQKKDIIFQDTTVSNDIVMQMYEVNESGVTKLDAVDYGEVVDTSDPTRPQKRVIFFGKVFLDQTLTATYVNLFTVVLD